VRARTLAASIVVFLVALFTATSQAAAAVPTGFQESVVFSGLTEPTAVRFASDGRIFVAEKSGLIKVFDGVTDSTPTVFADLRTNVHNFWDRGLLGLALDPGFPANPYVYALYTHDAAIGGTAPRWGTAGATSDGCPDPTGNGCVVSGRLSRLQAAGNVMTGTEQVLIEDWCQQYPSHSIGTLAFGADGALYVSGGDGASFTFTDSGQTGNVCGDPAGEGGALRSQDLRTRADPVGLNGAVLRVDPSTGAGLPDNPLASDPDANARRIIAYGLRNPFRIVVRPGTSEVWIGDVGYNVWEEINRVANPTDAVVENFGWPCYEGVGRQSAYDSANLAICENLYAQGGVTAPFYTYSHSAQVVPGETCPTGGSSIAGVAFSFYGGGPYPASYDGALFFADYSRDCIWVMFQGGNGLPNPGSIANFVAPAQNPVDVQISPSGELWYADFDGGAIRRISYPAGNRPPNAIASATPTSGPAPLTVNFDGSGSNDPDPGDTIVYAWDLDGDGAYDDSTAVQPTYTYTQPQDYTARLRVTDSRSASTLSDPIVISVGNTPPTASIDTPSPTARWRVGEIVSFSGSATDAQDGTLPASSLSWSLVLHHCPSNCHTHPIQDFPGVASGSFTAPDHDYPAHLELRLTATDSRGLTDVESIQLDPLTVPLTFQSSPTGLQLAVGGTSSATPFTRTVIVGSRNTVSATSPQTLGSTSYVFSSWSDGGAQTHDIVAPEAAATYTASFTSAGPSGLVAAYAFDEASGATVTDASGSGNSGTISGAVRTAAGRYGGALTFDGVNDWVTVADANSLDLTNGMTLQAWVYPTALGTTWRTVLFKERPGGIAYSLFANQSTTRPVGQVFIGSERNAVGPAALALNTWTHLAATFDGAALRLYVNGSLVTTTAVAGSVAASTGALRIGGNNIWPEWFAGRIDQVRVYRRALTLAEIQSDMTTPVRTDTAPPTAPASLVASGSVGAVSLSWNAATDDTGVLRYNVHRSTVPGFTPSTANRVAQPSGTSYTDSGLAPGTYYYVVTAEDVAGNVGPASNQASATATADTTAPSVSITAPAAGETVSGVIDIEASASDDVGVASVRFRVDGVDVGVEDTQAPYSVSWNTVAASNGSHTLTALAQDAAGNPTTSAPVSVTVDNPPQPSGLVAAYAFDEASGTTVADASGNANTGTISGATRTTAGRYGGALTFDGLNDWVTVADANSLDLTSGMTLEAWVYPTALGTVWRTVLFKERPGGLVYGLYANESSSRPIGQVDIGGERNAVGSSTLALNAWTHLAATYDGASLRLYVNGALVTTTAFTGAIPDSTGVLRMGGNGVWPEWFAGRIDQVRVHNRALGAGEIQTNMTTPIA
jgi:PKD repeat protein